VIQLLGQFVPVKLNAEKEGRQAAKKYKIQGFPTILFLTATGEVAGKIVGYRPPAPFAEEVAQVIQDHKEFPQLQARIKQNPSDTEAAARLAGILIQRGDLSAATQMLAQAEKADPENSKGHLTGAYLALAETYLQDEKADEAKPLLRKVIASGKKPADLATAHLMLAFCFFSEKKPKEALAELEAIVKMPDAPEDLKKTAERGIAELKKMLDN